MTIQQIIDRLGCREYYAKKLIQLCRGDEEEIRRTVAEKAHELQTRSAVVEFKQEAKA